MPVDAAPPTIFVVDDDSGLLRLIQRALQREGFDVATAASGEKAIAWLTENRADLMLLDLKLQDREGMELMNQLAANERALPFIVITGQGDERVAVEMMKRGALDYLVKDVDFLHFVPEVVRRALAQIDREKRLVEAEAQAKRLEKELLEISDREQRRIGQDLHDGLGQQLTAIELMCETLRSDLGSASPDVQKHAGQICEFLRQAVSHTRALAHGLAPFKVETGGLQAALRELAQTTSAIRRIKCRLESSEPVSVQDGEAVTHLYRIAQEAVSNAVRHSRATEVVIRLLSQNGKLRLEVADNGKGLLPAPKSERGMGLQIMKHRATVIGAELKFESLPGKGVTVICSLPNAARKKKPRTAT
jgi:signal transduction histidine kinase